jgi:hydroxymethylpyrimidine/phosphomethylpyrimidine kinase
MTASISSSTASSKKKYRATKKELNEELKAALEAIPIDAVKTKLMVDPTVDLLVSHLPICTVLL